MKSNGLRQWFFSKKRADFSLQHLSHPIFWDKNLQLGFRRTWAVPTIYSGSQWAIWLFSSGSSTGFWSICWAEQRRIGYKPKSPNNSFMREIEDSALDLLFQHFRTNSSVCLTSIIAWGTFSYVYYCDACGQTGREIRCCLLKWP